MWPSLDNPGMAKLLGNPGILGQGGGGYVCGHPWTIPGWLSYLGILGYLDKGGVVCVWPSLDNPGILGQGGGMCVAIPGQSRDG